MIGIGESYMAGEWSTGAGTDLADALTPFAERLTDLIKPVFYRLRHAVLPRGLNPENTKDGARQNIEAHYDLSNDMFAQFLDPTLSYSSALFDSLDPPPAQADHEAAQLAKIDAVLDAAGVRAGLTRARDRHRLGHARDPGGGARRDRHDADPLGGAGRARPAADRRRRGVATGSRSRVRDYRDEDGTYDAVVSVEMIEAVGEEFWPTYFPKIDEVLAPGGRVAIQAILLAHDRMVATRNTYGWIHKYIFPGGLLPSTEAIEQVTREHTSLHVSNIRPIGRHYAHTLRLWREQFLANWDEVEALGFDDTFRRMWEFYLAYCEAGFRSGYLDGAILIER